MVKMLVIFLAGIIVATVGFSGLAQLIDSGVSKVQETLKEAVQ
jgi:hypothetical protein